MWIVSLKCTGFCFQQGIFYLFYLILFIYLFIYLLIFRERGRERERKREKHQCKKAISNDCLSHTPQTIVKPVTFHSVGWCPTNWAPPFGPNKGHFTENWGCRILRTCPKHVAFASCESAWSTKCSQVPEALWEEQHKLQGGLLLSVSDYFFFLGEVLKRQDFFKERFCEAQLYCLSPDTQEAAISHPLKVGPNCHHQQSAAWAQPWFATR